MITMDIKIKYNVGLFVGLKFVDSKADMIFKEKATEISKQGFK